MRWSVIHADDDFTLSGRSAPRFPCIVNDDGVTHRALNAYLRYRLVTRKRDIKTVRDKDAFHITSFLNYLYLTVNHDDAGALDTWLRVRHGKMILFQNLLTEEGKSTEVRNQYIMSIYQFYWYCEHAGYCDGLVGINDSSVSDYEYPLFVLKPPANSPRQYKIPLLETVRKRQRQDIDSPEAWDRALESAVAGETAIDERNELMLRMVRESNVRREELAHLNVRQFSESPNGPHMVFGLTRDKNSKKRHIKVNIELYRDIQDYIEFTRPELISGKRDDGYVFTGLNQSGRHLSLSYINDIFASFNVRPHDGRSVSLTERFIDLINSGVSKETAMMLVSQEAGHSLASKGKTLEHCYVQAEAIAKAATHEPIGLLKSQLLKKERKIDELRDVIAKQQALIDELQRVISTDAAH